MKTINHFVLPALLLAGSASIHAAENTLLFGCSASPSGAGLEVVFADASAPIALQDGSIILPANLKGTRCVELVQLLLENELIQHSQLAASNHLVINTERKEENQQEGGTTNIPDCIIWDIDSADVTAQLICDAAPDPLIVGQDSAGSTSVTNYLGWSCVDALDDLGGLSNVIRSSVMRPRQEALRQTPSTMTNPIPGSIRVYQLALADPQSDSLSAPRTASPRRSAPPVRRRGRSR